MADLIDRSETQTELMMKCERYTLARESHGFGRVEWSGELISLSDAMDVIRDMPTAEPQWIPCDTGEPDEDMECWVTVKTTEVLYRGNFTKRYGERRDKGFITSGGFMWWNTALAWMPIYEPEPYTERRTDG